MKQQNQIMDNFTPFIPATKILPELTFRSIVLGLILALIFAASTCYLGLKVGRTISASIPSAVLSMAILRWFKDANILENNIVQTAASAGEVVAGGALFTLPALVMMGYWTEFRMIEMVSLCILGGILGILCSVPLRRVMIVQEKLPYPEGIAAAEVLKVGEDTQSSTAQVKKLMLGAVFGASMSIAQSALKVVAESFSWVVVKGGTIFGLSYGFSPILLAAGRIIGVKGTFGIGVGALITWIVGIPLYVLINGFPADVEVGNVIGFIGKTHFRYAGVGAMVVGGLWSVVSLITPIKTAIKSSFRAMKTQAGESANSIRTESDIPMSYVVISILLLSLPIFILLSHTVEQFNLPITEGTFWAVTLFATIFSLIVGFLGSSIAAYITGVVGSSLMPLSGVTIAAISLFSGCFLLIVGTQIDFSLNADHAMKAAVLAIMIGAIVCIATALSGDNMQDLKAGYILGATPWKQQLMLVIGVIASAFVIAPIMNVLLEAYGLGDVLPRLGMDPTKALAAPQASLMVSVTKGVFAQNLPWNMIILGAGIAVCTIIADSSLKRNNSAWRLPALSVALGMYLPLSYTLPLVVGGLIGYIVQRNFKKKDLLSGNQSLGRMKKMEQESVLVASGVIAAEAIMGIALAIPFAVYQSDEIFSIMPKGMTEVSQGLGFLSIGALVYYFFKIGRPKEV